MRIQKYYQLNPRITNRIESAKINSSRGKPMSTSANKHNLTDNFIVNHELEVTDSVPRRLYAGFNNITI
jgi:hypothetical protein